MPASALPAVVSGLPALWAGHPVMAEEPSRSLPMPTIAYGVLAFVAFLLGLGVLWTFRNTHAKVPDRGEHNDAEMHG